jgi:protein-S-isoprenylcysteine O-methyltransferase Ste14
MSLLNLDFVGRVLLATSLTVFAVFGMLGIFGMLAMSPKPDWFLLDLTARLAGFVFMSLLIVFTVIRLPPKSESLGWIPRIVAIAGTFMSMTLVLLPQADVPPIVRTIAAAMVLVGTGLSAYCLTWLGRSFSIDAQARRLVTGGPYSIVRHPLYLCEALALVGISISNLSVWSVTIVGLNLALQYWRIVNEERVLASAFEEYDAYCRAVPQILPRFSRSVA